MDNSNGKGKVRNRYAKLQPLVNRINEVQGTNSTSNYHHVKQFDKSGIFDSYAYQLRNDFENLVLAEHEVAKKPIDTEVQNSKIPATFFAQSIHSPGTNSATVRKQKKPKHRNKERLYRTSLLDFKTELLDILNCILYVMWSPIVFFARLLLSVTRSSISALYDILKLFDQGGRSQSQEGMALQSVEKKPGITNDSSSDSQEVKQALNSNNFPTKRSSDYNPGSRLILQGVGNSVAICQTQTEDTNCQKELQSLRKKFNLSLEMVDEMRGYMEIDNENYFQYSSHRQDGEKKATRQHQTPISIAGNKLSSSTLRNSSFKGSKTIANSKRLHIDSKNFSRRSELGFLMKDLNARLPAASGPSEKESKRIDPKNRSHTTDEKIDSEPESIDRDASLAGAKDKSDGCKEASVTLSANFTKERCEKPRPYGFPPLSLRPTLQKKSSSSEGENKCGRSIEKSDRTLDDDLKSNPPAPNESQNSKSQPIVESDRRITKKLKSDVDINRDLLQKKELNPYNAQKLIGIFSSLQCRPDLDMLKNKTAVPRSLKDAPVSEGVAQRDEEMKEVEKVEEKAENDLPESEGVCMGLEKEKRVNGSGDRPGAMKIERTRTTEFTKPIDAKSKWIEMKKKFYGRDYTAEMHQPEKLEARNLTQIKSVSKLPAHKMFQYNMQVGRARQMGTEPPSAEEIFLEKKATSPCFKATENNPTGFHPNRNEPQFAKSAISTPRCLSHTQSLSQWPLDQGNLARPKKYSSPLQKPKPKPRTEGGFNRDGIQAEHRTPAELSQRSSTRPNSSVSSSNFRDGRVSQNETSPPDWRSPVKNSATNNGNSSDEYTQKIDSLISFCSYASPPPKESIDKDLKRDNQTDRKVVVGDSS